MSLPSPIKSLADTQKPIDRLLAIMAQLRNPNGGCEWDLAQDFESIARYTIEEAYEVSDAIQSGSADAIKDELGDLLLQVVFHSQIAADKNMFVFDDVCDAICDKMERRHPHIFGDAKTDDVKRQWEEIKAAERANKGEGQLLDGIALSLPALMRAQKIQSRVARVGFDWPDVDGPRAKILEELDEVDSAENEAHRAEEIGDLLFAVVNYARHLGVDSEAALASANAKFARRFSAVEELANGSLDGLTLDQLENYWSQVKEKEKTKF